MNESYVKQKRNKTDQDVLNTLINNKLDYPRYEIKVKDNNNIISTFLTNSQESAHLIATILLKIPTRKSATITFFKNAYNSEIREIIKYEKPTKTS